MIHASEKFVPYEAKTSLVKIFSYTNGNMTGALYNPYFERDLYFESIVQLFLLLDELQNSLSYPQESMRSRQFQKKKDAQERCLYNEKIPQATPIATVKMSILFRQNASWQGTVVWTDRTLEAQFRSVWELIQLLDEVLR